MCRAFVKPDTFYTPPGISRRLVECVDVRQADLVADFAAGDGELLRRAEIRWPEATMLAVDVDHRTVEAMRLAHSTWLHYEGDFLSEEWRNTSGLEAALGSVAVALLNPPFSCRGGEFQSLALNGHQVRCSTAVAFVALAVPYMRSDGQIACLLPSSSLFTQKDEAAWAALREIASVEVISEFGRNAFRGGFAQSSLVKIELSKACASEVTLAREVLPCVFSLRVARGATPVHLAELCTHEDCPSFVHTTDLSGATVSVPERRICNPSWTVTGPAVLIPRVGRPRRDKISLYQGNEELALSDCVVGLVCQSTESAESVRELLDADWPLFAAMYRGSCAPYLTMRALAEFLAHRGVCVEPFAGSRRPLQLKKALELGCRGWRVPAVARDD